MQELQAHISVMRLGGSLNKGGAVQDVVRYVPQDLNAEQQAQARANIGIVGTGKDGVGVVSITANYAVTRDTTPPTRFSTTMPEVTAVDKYLWTMDLVQYTDGTNKYMQPRIIGAYLTDTEQQAIQNYVAVELAKRGQIQPEFANTVSECTDTSKLYVLPDGYIYAYVATTEASSNNEIPNSINTDGTQYVGENGEDGYKPGYRLNSSGGETTLETAAATGFIPIEYGDKVYFKNFQFKPGVVSTGAYICLYDSNFTLISGSSAQSGQFESQSSHMKPYTVDDDGYLTSITINYSYGDRDHSYIRISAIGLDANTIATVNEEITDGEATSYAWKNTGHAFVPADYEDRVIAMEDDVAMLKKAVQGDMAVYGIVDEENNILMAGTLASGKYKLKYLNEDGTTTEIGEFTMV